MFKQIPAPDHVLAMQFADKMSAGDVSQCKALLDAKLGKHQHMGALVDFTALSDISADALATGIQADLDMLAHIGQLQRLAFVSDKEFPTAIVGMLKPLLAGLELKSFKAAERDAGVKWVGEAPAQAQEKGPKTSLRLVPTSKDNVLAFEIDGPITAESMKGLTGDIKAFLDKHDKVRMLAHVKHLGGIDPTIFMQSGLISMKLAAMDKVERYAIVGAPSWMSKAADALGPVITDMEMRTFSESQQDDAWKWIGARAA